MGEYQGVSAEDQRENAAYLARERAERDLRDAGDADALRRRIVYLEKTLFEAQAMMVLGGQRIDRIRAAASAVRRGNPQCPGELVPSQVDALLAAIEGGVYHAPVGDPSALHAIILAQKSRLDAIRAAAKPLFEADLTDHDEDCALRECNSPRNTRTLEPVCACNCELRHVSALLVAIGEP